ncbi:uncharacterized protein LOC101853899 [Aplysia californica]|uniref:Uncharacterized protein LOC101853899 n=1 Tax=Aplysia californica TaxID=6500 RepID=A0ABM1W3L6_APLCA|nr:uncharacterized protein LOC101853899 [Aplysia californica]
MTSLNLRLDAFDNTLFYSTVMENRTKYMVSRPFLLNTAIAESLCQLYGGYLVEINDGHEYTVVKRVLEGAKANDDVLVGVTDEFQEGVWRYREHKTQTVTFLLWDNSKPEPDGGAAENCATLGADVGWKLQDRKCYDNTAHVRFMCEVENA